MCKKPLTKPTSYKEKYINENFDLKPKIFENRTKRCKVQDCECNCFNEEKNKNRMKHRKWQLMM